MLRLLCHLVVMPLVWQKKNTEVGLQLRMPIIADGAQEIMKPHEV